MILRIARREILDMIRDGRFRAAVAVIGVLVVSALAARWLHTRMVRADTQRRQPCSATCGSAKAR